MTARDRTVVTVIAALVLVAAAWFLLLAPVRKDAKALDEQITTAQSRLTAAQAVVTQGNAAKTAYRDDYAAVSRLGKAVPADDDVPSLVVQLESAADRSRVDFRSIELTTGGAATAAPAAAPAPTGATGTTGPAAPAGAVAPAGSVPATQAAASALPPGAVVGPAGFPTMPFDFAFTGSFFKLQDFLARLDRFTQVEGEDITVRGRLLTVDGFSLSASAKGFPSMLASVHATAYLLPSEESADAGSASLSTPAAPPVATTPPGAAGAPASPAPVTGAGPR